MKPSTGVLASVLLAGCVAGAPAADQDAEAAELMRISREWSATAATGDTEALLAVWADDAIIMVPGQAPIRGKQAIRAFVESSGSIPGFSVRWEPLEAHVSAAGDMAYLIERNQFTWQDSTGTLITESNKAVTVWRKQPDGAWKNVVDMWNADPAAWGSGAPD